MSSIVQPTPDLTGSFRVDFRPNEFDANIWQKGYRATLEKALRCPCHNGDVPRNTCTNCGGLGWAFVDTLQTKVIEHSMSLQRQKSNWSELDLGTSSFTTLSNNRVTYMDRITLLDVRIIFTDLIQLSVTRDDRVVGRTIYQPAEYSHIVVFVDDNNPLVSLDPQDIVTTGSVVEVVGQAKALIRTYNVSTISVRYTCAPSFHVISLNREAVNSDVIQSDGNDVNYPLPANGIMRRAHYMFDRWAPTQLSQPSVVTNQVPQQQLINGRQHVSEIVPLTY